jgi:DNA polymerase-3 subunit alpha
VKLVSKGYLEGFYYKPRVDKELLREHSEGLIGLSACLNGEVSANVLAGRIEQAEKAASEYQDIFGKDRFFLEIHDHGLEKQRKIIPDMLRIGERTGIRVAATNDCHYMQQDDSRAHDILLCIQTGKTGQRSQPDEVLYGSVLFQDSGRDGSRLRRDSAGIGSNRSNCGAMQSEIEKSG